MDDQLSGIPRIYIFSSVLRFIEEQVLMVADHLETGGLLLGTIMGSDRLITHATPPGPNAIQHESVFEKDLEFSQAILNYLAQKTGVDYIGEWHKHPPSLKKPSTLDKQSAIEILLDTDYKTNGLLVLPIWVKENREPPSTVHQFLVEHYFGPIDIVKIFPYYMNETLEFYPFDFQVIKCDLGTQIEVERFYDHYITLCQGQTFLGLEGSKEINQTQSNQQDKDIITNIDTTPYQQEQVIQLKSEEEIEQICQWYQTETGRKRLIKETEHLKRSKNYRFAKILDDGRLLYRLSSPIYSGFFLDVICAQDHPLSFPDLVLQFKGHSKQMNFADFIDENNNQNFYHLKLTGLLKMWREQEKHLFIYHIAEKFGFGQKEKQEMP